MMHKLVEIGIEVFNEKKMIQRHKFTDNSDADRYLNDIKNYPHIFVLACLMDRQISAEKAWIIPYNLCSYFEVFTNNDLAKLSKQEIIDWFVTTKPHRYNEIMAEVFYQAVQRIHEIYNDDASLIWANSPSSAAVVFRFLQFQGAGVKIATMATNILIRELGVELSDYYSIDVSPDSHILKIFNRLGLVETEDNKEMVIYKARELYPIFPGVVDVACWEIGRKYCSKQYPKCKYCPLNTCCAFAIKYA